MEFLHGTSAQTGNTDLAAALGTLGIPRDPGNELRVFKGEMDSVCFYFQAASDCGTYHTSRMIPAWDATDFHRTHPLHAMTYMRCALRSRARLLEYAHGHGRIALSRRPGGQFEVVQLPQGDARRATVPRGSSPDPASTPTLHTDDLELAACLLACGIPLWKEIPFERKAGHLTFFFHAASEDGRFHTAALMLAWKNGRWHEDHPEHPFAYLTCVMENRRRLIREIKARAPMVVFQRAGYPHFLSLNADAKTETVFMRELRKL